MHYRQLYVMTGIDHDRFSSVQDCIYALGKVPMRSAPSLKSFITDSAVVVWIMAVSPEGDGVTTVPEGLKGFMAVLKCPGNIAPFFSIYLLSFYIILFYLFYYFSIYLFT